MEILSLEEISDWRTFEDLIADYFREAKNDNEFNINNVIVQQTGTGADGGRDILVDFTINDSIITFNRKWVVQCKFHKKDVNKSHLSDVNIPSLLHQYGADGYLLVCKKHYTSPVSDMFEGFNKKCPFKRSYNIWNGQNLLNRIRFKEKIIADYFPKYQRYFKDIRIYIYIIFCKIYDKLFSR